MCLSSYKKNEGGAASRNAKAPADFQIQAFELNEKVISGPQRGQRSIVQKKTVLVSVARQQHLINALATRKEGM
jgi:hypothetical protein